MIFSIQLSIYLSSKKKKSKRKRTALGSGAPRRPKTKRYGKWNFIGDNSDIKL